MLLAHYLMHALNPTGAILLTITTLIVSVYLVSTFTMSKLAVWFAGPFRFFSVLGDAWRLWREERLRRNEEKARRKAAERTEKRRRTKPAEQPEPAPTRSYSVPEPGD